MAHTVTITPRHQIGVTAKGFKTVTCSECGRLGTMLTEAAAERLAAAHEAEHAG